LLLSPGVLGHARGPRRLSIMEPVPGPKPDPERPIFRGTVKFWKASGMGGIESQEASSDVYVGLSSIDMPGYRVLEAGQAVEFQFISQQQDSWLYKATWVRPMGGDD
jgi:CspA family cold shock protein